MSYSCQGGVDSTARREPSLTAFQDSSSTTSPTVFVVVFHRRRVFLPAAQPTKVSAPRRLATLAGVQRVRRSGGAPVMFRK